MKILKILFLVFVDAFFGFIIWMNVTPGHFQRWTVCHTPVYADINSRVCESANLDRELECFCRQCVSAFCAPNLPSRVFSEMLMIAAKADMYK